MAVLDNDGRWPLLLRLCVVLTILSVHLSGRLTISMNERSKGQYTAHIITRTFDNALH